MESVVVAVGQWLYDGTAPTTVRIVRLDYDFWYEIGKADGDLEPDEAPQLNDDGYLYYVKHRSGWPDSQGFPTPEEAIAAAESQLPTAVEWEWHAAKG
jgi:hypothetical protein